MPDTVTGKRFVILGGSSGIGFGVAKLALEQGAGEVIIASSTQGKVDAATQRLSGFARQGSKVTGRTIDLSEVDNVAPFFEDLGNFDHLVSTAGSSFPKDQFPDGCDLNLIRAHENDRFWSVLRAAQVSYKQINEGGTITVTSGSVIKHPLKGWSGVAGIVGAIETAARSMALDLAPIRVNCVAPGVVLTEMWDTMDPKVKEQMIAQVSKSLPVGRAGVPDEIAEAYLYLWRSTFTTGQTLFVDGGRGVI